MLYICAGSVMSLFRFHSQNEMQRLLFDMGAESPRAWQRGGGSLTMSCWSRSCGSPPRSALAKAQTSQFLSRNGPAWVNTQSAGD